MKKILMMMTALVFSATLFLPLAAEVDEGGAPTRTNLNAGQKSKGAQKAGQKGKAADSKAKGSQAGKSNRLSGK